MLKSGLRGRGGAGFPTGMKWQFAAASKADQKYVVCNADEGDPGAFMDRSVLEGDPHAVHRGHGHRRLCHRRKRRAISMSAPSIPSRCKRLQIAIDQAREYGLLGENIFGTDFNFDLDIRLGAGAFVCGEETALMTLHRGQARRAAVPRPPFPAVQRSVRQAHHPQQRGNAMPTSPRSS